MNKSLVAKLAAIVYVVWGLLHLQAAYLVYTLAASLDPGIVHGRMLQHAWNLMFASVAAIGVAVTLNWRNSSSGYWINTVLVSLFDLGFVLFVLVPGLVPMWPGLLGPITWILAWCLSTAAFVSSAYGPLKPAGA